MSHLKTFLSVALTVILFARPSSAYSAHHSFRHEMYRIVEAEDQRRLHDPFLAEMLRSRDSRLRDRALVALGRIADPSSLDDILSFLNHDKVSTRVSAADALAVLGNDAALAPLRHRFSQETSPRVKVALLSAIGQLGGQEDVPLVASAVMDDRHPSVRAAALETLGTIWLKATADWATPEGLLKRLTELTLSSKKTSINAGYALSRFRGSPAQLPLIDVAQAIETSRWDEARALLMRTLGKIKTDASGEIARRRLAQDPWWGARVEAVRALSVHAATSENLASMKNALSDPNPHVVIEAMSDLGHFGSASSALVPDVEHNWLHSSSAWIRGTALETLASMNFEGLRSYVDAALRDDDQYVLQSGVRCLAKLGTAADLSRLVSFIEGPDSVLAIRALEALGDVAPEKIPAQTKETLETLWQQHDPVLATLIVDFATKQKWSDLLPIFVDDYSIFNGPDGVDVRSIILNMAGLLGSHDDATLKDFVTQALTDPNRNVIAAAADAFKLLTGVDASDRIPLVSRDYQPTAAPGRINHAMTQKVVLITSRGSVELRMTRDAPVVAENFIRLVNQGFYNGLVFHRVVPNFVVQGGDPRGTGYGGPGYSIRDSFSPRRHIRGSVGMASSGKDTAGSQFFINHAANLSLDWKYTVFANVTVGMDVVDRLEEGDSIVEAFAY